MVTSIVNVNFNINIDCIDKILLLYVCLKLFRMLLFIKHSIWYIQSLNRLRFLIFNPLGRQSVYFDLNLCWQGDNRFDLYVQASTP